MTDPAFWERHALADGGAGEWLDRQKRRARQGYYVRTVYLQRGPLQGAADELLAYGWRRFGGGEPEPDRSGQTEIDLDGL